MAKTTVSFSGFYSIHCYVKEKKQNLFNVIQHCCHATLFIFCANIINIVKERSRGRDETSPFVPSAMQAPEVFNKSQHSIFQVVFTGKEEYFGYIFCH